MDNLTLRLKNSRLLENGLMAAAYINKQLLLGLNSFKRCRIGLSKRVALMLLSIQFMKDLWPA